ncbi:spermidine synthase [Sulfurimonas sp.]|uniref:spermine/spermidine synthase domain-containing protein n=1 Tax=Sulfurimonas sp. TaxID=2022749 RepID=UPI002AB22FE4|nr:spermidine synthase [Sulfurimonas sp.]
MKEFIYPEMMVHVPVCTSKNPQNVLIISDNASRLEAEMKKHDEINYKVISCCVDAIRDEVDSSVDVVICEKYDDSAILAHISRVLKDDGQLSISHPSLKEVDANKSLMGILGKYFKVVMPYNLYNGYSALIASKEYHPTADINLHRAEMLDDLNFYNCDVHIAAFAMGNYIRKEYLGIIKN